MAADRNTTRVQSLPGTGMRAPLNAKLPRGNSCLRCGRWSPIRENTIDTSSSDLPMSDGHSLRSSAIILSVTRPPQRRFRHAALGFASQPCDWFAFVEDRRRQGLAASEAGCASLTCETDAVSTMISHWKPMSDSPGVKHGPGKNRNPREAGQMP